MPFCIIITSHTRSSTFILQLCQILLNHQTCHGEDLPKRKIHPCGQLPLPSHYLARKIHLRPGPPATQSLSVHIYQQHNIRELCSKIMIAYLLVRIHSGKSALAGLASFRSDLLNFLLGTVGEVTGVRVVGHVEGCEVKSCRYFPSDNLIRRLVCLLELVD